MYTDLRQDPYPVVFLSANQVQTPGEFQRVIVRSALAYSAVTSGIIEVAREVNPAVVVYLASLDTQVSDTLVRERLMARLSGFFGVLAALLAIIGLYGVVAYTVVRRTNEIGVRMALGARPSQMMQLVLSRGVALAVVGAGLGMAGAYFLMAGVQTQLYGIEARDPATFAWAAAALILVAVLACAIPARRAMRVDPVTALRCE